MGTFIQTVTPQSFAYIQGQIDYPKKERIHLTMDGKKTVCGRRMGGWEFGPDVKFEDVSGISWLCEKCEDKLNKVLK